MKKKRSHNNSPFAAFIIALFIVAFCVALGYFNYKMQTEKQAAIDPQGVSGAQKSAQIPEETQSVKIIPGAQFVFITKYTLTQKSLSETIIAPDEAVGGQMDNITQMYPQWEIDSFNPDKVVFVKTISSYSPGSYLLCIDKIGSEEKLVLYEYDKEGKAVISEVFETAVETFSEDEKQKLYNGIVVLSEEGLEYVLQNYAE